MGVDWDASRILRESTEMTRGGMGSFGALWGPWGRLSEVTWEPRGGRLGCPGDPMGADRGAPWDIWGSNGVLCVPYGDRLQCSGALWGSNGALWGPKGADRDATALLAACC